MSATTSISGAVPLSGGRIRTLTFPRSRRLRRNRLIQSLFDRARSDTRALSGGPVRILYRRVPRIETGIDTPVQIGFAVGRSAGNAVQRNRIKRLLREEYRQCRMLFEGALNHSGSCMVLMVVLRNARATAEEFRSGFRNALKGVVREDEKHRRSLISDSNKPTPDTELP